ncbi:uncharacterized protein HKW66_Vig0248850 [Vigna angularis]|uniref:Uncharacterized protein n=1 Tax=Phaseolus angularis TaxID=3914 RepID=A0A8T0JS75_PHAAN|nr:uncharacterized protein HKW66_Vig0248850 [Vigna angularis]
MRLPIVNSGVINTYTSERLLNYLQQYLSQLSWRTPATRRSDDARKGVYVKNHAPTVELNDRHGGLATKEGCPSLPMTVWTGHCGRSKGWHGPNLTG